MTSHALNLFIGQKTKKVRFSEKEFINVLNNIAKYYETDSLKDIKYYDNLAIVQDRNNKEIITIYRRNAIKEEWKRYE